MRCFSLIITMLLSSWLHAAVFNIEPLGQRKITTGDHIDVRIVPQVDGTEIPDLKGKRISGVFYVMEQKGDKLEVIVAPPKKVEETNLAAKEDRFVPVGFDYDFKMAQNIPDFLVEDSDYNLVGRAGLWWWVLLAVLIALLPLGFDRYKRHRRKKALELEIRKELERIKTLVDQASERKEIEKIYNHKLDLKECFEYDKSSFDAFFKILFDIQYKPAWSEDEKGTLLQALAKFKKDLRIKRGI